MEEPDWAKVIRVMYHRAPDVESALIDETHPYVEETDLNKGTVEKAIEALVSWGLAEKRPVTWKGQIANGSPPDEEAGYSLTKNGFEVAHQRELSKRDNSINRSLVVLTFGLVGVNMIQALSVIVPRGVALSVSASAVLIIVGIIIHRADY